MKTVLLFEYIWIASLVLIILSIIGMAALIVHRWYIEHLESNFQLRKKELLEAVFYAASNNSSPSGIAEVQLTLSKKDEHLIEQVIRELLPSLIGDDRNRIVQLLTSLKIPEMLIRKLNSRKHGIRASAIDALLYFNSDATAKALFHVLHHDQLPLLRLKAAVSLNENKRISDLSNTVKLIFAAGSPPYYQFKVFLKHTAHTFPKDLIALTVSTNRYIASAATEALGYSGDFSVLDHLISLLQKKYHKEIRIAALRSIRILEHPHCKNAIADALYDDDWEIRAQAVRCTGKISFPELIPRIVELLSDQSWWVRYWSAVALTEMEDDGKNALTAYLKKAGISYSGHDLSTIIALSSDLVSSRAAT
jgi:hypothetical protein